MFASAISSRRTRPLLQHLPGEAAFARAPVADSVHQRQQLGYSRIAQGAGFFALLHDACRHDDGYDPMHGQRAADAIAEGRAARPRPSSRCRSAQDADRLDLGRVGLCTKAAKDAKRIEWAYRRSLQRPTM